MMTTLSLVILLVASNAGAAQLGVALGAAEGYAVLAATTVTNTGPSQIGGDLGVSPGSAVTGFPPGIVNGTIHTADAGATQAKVDLALAYADAASRMPVITIGTELGGTTVTPGVYDSAAGTFGITGTLTLDAGGDANAVFIFEAASTLVTAAASSVILINGAQACNIFWKVGSSATLGTNSNFTGSILAFTSITVTTGTSIEGRALALNGAVTLDTNTITVPTCAAATPTPTVSPSPTDSPTPTVSPSPTDSPTPTVSPSPTDSPTPTVSPSPTDSPTPTVSPSPTDSPTPTVSPSPAPTPTVIVPSPTQVPIPSWAPTWAPAWAPTWAPTWTPAWAPTWAPTWTPSGGSTGQMTHVPSGGVATGGGSTAAGGSSGLIAVAITLWGAAGISFGVRRHARSRPPL